MQLAFGGLIAAVLLGLYIYAVYMAVAVVNCVTTKGCTVLKVENFTPGMVFVLTTVGGLVSALVIAELSVTRRGEAPMARALTANPPALAAATVKWIAVVYILAWVITGLWAFVVGYLLHPSVLQPLKVKRRP